MPVFKLTYWKNHEYLKKTGEKGSTHIFLDDEAGTLLKPFLEGEAVTQVDKLKPFDVIQANVSINEYTDRNGNRRIAYNMNQLKVDPALRSVSGS